ncbi:DNA repair protein rhp7 [Spatholobus suberectus]|nr:DNA repair protein rhp7 [Spatholobus suberectus]
MLPFSKTTLTPKPLDPTPTRNQHPQPPPPPSIESLPPPMTTTHPIPNSNSPPSHPLDLEIGFGGSDFDINALIDDFFDQPAPELPTLDNHGSTSASKDSLKRGIDSAVDYFEAAVSIKRGRINNVSDASFEIENPIPLFQDQGHSGDNGKRPVFEIDFLSTALREAELGLAQNSDNNANLDVEPDNVPYRSSSRRNRTMERFRVIAKENATRYARFTSDVGDEGTSPAAQGIDDCATPFSIAMKAIVDRAAKKWVSKRSQQGEKRYLVPSLKELCLKILADNADAMVSLESVPDELRHKLCYLLCDSRKMNGHFLDLLLSGAPTEIRLKDCSWLTEEQFAKSFQMCDTGRLQVLQLDQCGRCIPDYALLGTLSQSPRWLPRLTSLSLSGACRLSDKGLHVLVSSAPVLRSINLSQCSLLSSASVNILADSLGSLLKELYLDDCQIIDAAQIVPALKKLEHLEVLSLAGIQTVSDEFIKDYIIARGHNMKELVLKDCRKLTDASIKVIAEHCPGLCALDLMHLNKLTDLSVGYLTNSCLALHTLKLCRNPFSDEAIAAFLEVTGESLKELSLNNIKKVGHHTTLSLARHAKSLHTLDLSWCRNLTDNELGLIVDSCFSLRLLKLLDAHW